MTSSDKLDSRSLLSTRGLERSREKRRQRRRPRPTNLTRASEVCCMSQSSPSSVLLSSLVPTRLLSAPLLSTLYSVLLSSLLLSAPYSSPLYSSSLLRILSTHLLRILSTPLLRLALETNECDESAAEGGREGGREGVH